MIMIRAIVRPEKVTNVLSELIDAGFPAITKFDVYGRGKQRGVQVGELIYDEIPKEMLLLVCDDIDQDDAVRVILEAARTGKDGNFGDGRIFISPVQTAYTISTGNEGL
jgi:nitrogen regulatory protein PII 1